MSAMLRLKLKDKLPKPHYPEEYKKFNTILETTKDNWTMQCTLCSLTFKGRAHRANCHLIGKVGEGVSICSKITEQARLKFAEKVFPGLCDEETLLSDGPSLKKAKQSTISGFVNKANFDRVDSELSKFVLTSGVSFHAMRNPHLQQAFSNLNASYKVPSDYKLKGPLFEHENQDINEWKSEKLSCGLLCLTGDGWTNRRRVGCMNIECLTQHSGPIHYDTFQRTAATEQVNHQYVTDIFNKAIQELGGPDRIVGVVGDNEAKMRNAWKAIELDNPGVIAMPCSGHIGNLLMKDICKDNWVDTVLSKVKIICDHVLNHSFVLALFRQKVASHKELMNKDLKLPGKTRYGSNFTMIERAQELKVPLRELVVDERYENCDAFNREIQQWVLSPNFWEHVAEVIVVLEPVYTFIRFADGPKPDVGEVYEKFRDVGIKILQSGSTNAESAHRHFLRRLNGTAKLVKFHHPAHSAAMLLHPHHWDENYAAKYGPGEYAKIRADLVEIIGQVSKTPEAAVAALLQYDNEYKCKTLGSFQQPIIQQSAKMCPIAASWWEANACEVPELQYVAVRVLSLAIANSAAERNWSIHEFLQSKRRSRLGFEKQRMLVNVYVNLKLREKLLRGGALKYYSSEEFSDNGDEAESDSEPEEQDA